MLAQGKTPKVLIAADSSIVGRSRLSTFPRGDGAQAPRHEARKGMF